MGEYLIPDAASATEASAHVGFAHGRRWAVVPGGVLFSDPGLSDDECAALYVGFVPAGVSDEEYRQPLPDAVIAAGRVVKQIAYLDNAGLDALTVTELRIGLRAACRALLYLNSRFEE